MIDVIELQLQEDLLFRKWKEECGVRPNDGLVSSEDYARSSPRLMFLMKETNGEVPLSSFLRTGGRWQTWNNVVRWSRVLRTGSAGSRARITQQDRRDELRHLAIVNVKKEAGRARASPRALQEAVRRDGALLRRQIELYRPHAVVCCGQHVTEQLPEILDVRRTTEEKNMPFLLWHDTPAEAVAIPFYHPACRRPTAMMLDELLNIVKKNRLTSRWS